MGWASGSRIAEELWAALRPLTSEGSYGKVSEIIFEKFCEYDADDWELEISKDCLYYMYLKHNKPEELKEYNLD